MEIKVKEQNTPFWATEYDYYADRDNLERSCMEAGNLYEAILCGASMTCLFEEGNVGYLSEDGTIELCGDFQGKTEEELKAISVYFDNFGTDDDGLTTAIFVREKWSA